MLNARRARGWPSTTGRVVDSRIETDESSSDGGKSKQTVKVRYAYSVEGREFESERVTFFGINMRHTYTKTANEQRARFPKDGKVTVHYDPANPAKAVLDDIESAPPGMYFFAVALTGFGVLISLLTAVRMAIGR